MKIGWGSRSCEGSKSKSALSHWQGPWLIQQLVLRYKPWSLAMALKPTVLISSQTLYWVYASAAWDPYTARDSNKLDKVQRRAGHFVRRDYRRTTSASQLISELGWQNDGKRSPHAALRSHQYYLWTPSRLPSPSIWRHHWAVTPVVTGALPWLDTHWRRTELKNVFLIPRNRSIKSVKSS